MFGLSQIQLAIIGGVMAFLDTFDWPKWAREHQSQEYLDGRCGIYRSANPYPAGSWKHEQWSRGYDESPILGG